MFRIVKKERRVAAVLTALLVLPWAAFARPSSAIGRNISPIPPMLYRVACPLWLDVDGDSRLENIRLLSNGFSKTLAIRFGNSRYSNVSFETKSANRGVLFAYDIDHDSQAELIWVSSFHQPKTAVVLDDDGKGNFIAAKDDAHYAQELSSLLLGDSPPDPYSFQFTRHERASTSSSSHLILPATRQLVCETAPMTLFAGVELCASQFVFLRYVHKRGPPLVVS